MNNDHHAKPYPHLRHGCRTDVGRRRASNEDSLLCLPDQGLYAVADGMGGAQAGELASKITVDAVQHAFAHFRDEPGVNNLTRKRVLLQNAANKACRKIQEVVRRHSLAQSGSTFAALGFDINQPAQGMALHAGTAGCTGSATAGWNCSRGITRSSGGATAPTARRGITAC
ncbi:MAG: protein phosphatase 2C domain-containing protein [Kiritimatiellia bacterium]